MHLQQNEIFQPVSSNNITLGNILIKKVNIFAETDIQSNLDRIVVADPGLQGIS